jgi:hypothetical protein
MLWKIYPKLVRTDAAIGDRWFWRKPVVEGRSESAVGFLTRDACVANALKHGYTPEQDDSPTRNFGV